VGQPKQRHLPADLLHGDSLNINGVCTVRLQHRDADITRQVIVIKQNTGVTKNILNRDSLDDLAPERTILRTLDNNQISCIALGQDWERLFTDYELLFHSGLGHCTKLKAHVELKPDAFFKPLPIPFTMKTRSRPTSSNRNDSASLPRSLTRAGARRSCRSSRQMARSGSAATTRSL
jgi:hypothetical protein